MCKIALALMSSLISANLVLYTDFYSLFSDQPLKVTKQTLDSEQLKLIQDFIEITKLDQVEASRLTESLLQGLGFKFTKINNEAPYNYLLTEVPDKYFFKQYLGKVLEQSGTITLVFDEPLNSTISRATPTGIRLDPLRFFLALDKPMAIVPHEVLHFVHLQNLKNGKVFPYNSVIQAQEPLLATYKSGFLLDEIEAHLGDALLMKHRGIIAGESYLDAKGKASLVYLMLDQVKTSLDFIDQSLKNNSSEYLKNYFSLQTDTEQFGIPVTALLFVYQDRHGQSLMIQMFSNLKPQDVGLKDLHQMLIDHRQWMDGLFQKLNTEFNLNNFEDAKGIILKQASKLIPGSQN
jgi:hypothetical protein